MIHEEKVLQILLILFGIFGLVNSIYGYNVYSQLLNTKPKSECATYQTIENNMKLYTLIYIILSGILVLGSILYFGLDIVRFRGEYNNLHILRSLVALSIVINGIFSGLFLFLIEEINDCYGIDAIDTLHGFYAISSINISVSIISFISIIIYSLKTPIVVKKPEPPKPAPKTKSKEELEIEQEAETERLKRQKEYIDAAQAAISARKQAIEKQREAKVKALILKEGAPIPEELQKEIDEEL